MYLRLTSPVEEQSRQGDDFEQRVEDIHKTVESDELKCVLARTADRVSSKAPLWIVYPKGKHNVNESTVRSTAKAAGLMYTKAVSVSATRTGLSFHARE